METALAWLLTSRWADDILLALFVFAICWSCEAAALCVYTGKLT